MKYLWQCAACEAVTETEQSIHAPEVLPPEHSCPACQESAYLRIYEAPEGRTRQSASFLDGHRQDKGWAEMKRAAKLEVERARSNNEEDRKELQKDINKMRTIK